MNVAGHFTSHFRVKCVCGSGKSDVCPKISKNSSGCDWKKILSLNQQQKKTKILEKVTNIFRLACCMEFHSSLETGFIFVRTVCVQNGKCSPFSQTHSHASTNATRCHEYFRGLSRLLLVPGVLVSFLEPLKKPSQSQKGHFYNKMNVLNDTKIF